MPERHVFVVEGSTVPGSEGLDTFSPILVFLLTGKVSLPTVGQLESLYWPPCPAQCLLCVAWRRHDFWEQGTLETDFAPSEFCLLHSADKLRSQADLTPR